MDGQGRGIKQVIMNILSGEDYLDAISFWE